MTAEQIRFDNADAYERYMGKWSQLAGDMFLDWLTPAPGLRWLDVGCGNGVFTEMLVDRCAPAAVDGIDPSAEQIAHARIRPGVEDARFHQGDAMALPFPDRSFDAAVMPLVIFFVPDPALGVAEMVRTVDCGGIVSAYAWDMYGGGFPYRTLQDEVRGLGIDLPKPPSPEASRLETMTDLWKGAGLLAVETTRIIVRRTYSSFDDYWATILGGPSLGRTFAAMTPDDLLALKNAIRAKLSIDANGIVACTACANAVKGRVPD